MKPDEGYELDKLTVTGNKGRAEVRATGVGGEWFSFPSLPPRSGSYINEDSLMHDQVAAG